GAAGFIGSHLCEALLGQGHDVAGLDNFDPFYAESEKRSNLAQVSAAALKLERTFVCHTGDICDREAVQQVLQGADAVVHLAALAGVRPSLERPERYVAVNVDGTANLLQQAQLAGIRRFVFASSSSVYGNNPQVPFAEHHAVDHPISPYAATKKAGELLCHTWHHLYGINIACLRFFTVYGPRQRPDLAIRKFCQSVLQDQEITLFGDGSTSRDYTYVADTVAGILGALQWTGGAGQRFDVFNLGNSHPVSLAELVRAVESATGKTARIRSAPMQAGDVERTFADIQKAGEVLGYHPATPLEQGMAQMVAWLRATSGPA
ncbi:MAG: GDP-mannose 4,6-dehydratase, partial [Deltaproteobacteria bacterium]|nr:GDP-mannose 4,6-dehydratase [Deltaproteobacteria bacterium]